jgi:hypothetical protein
MTQTEKKPATEKVDGLGFVRFGWLNDPKDRDDFISKQERGEVA